MTNPQYRIVKNYESEYIVESKRITSSYWSPKALAVKTLCEAEFMLKNLREFGTVNEVIIEESNE